MMHYTKKPTPVYIIYIIYYYFMQPMEWLFIQSSSCSIAA